MSFPYDKTMNQICNVHFIEDANDVLLGASGVCIFLHNMKITLKCQLLNKIHQNAPDTIGRDQIYHKSFQVFLNTSIFMRKFKNP